ncbi:MAG: 4-hydroxy-3-methylbut-2-en-1-yl diphosphate synthase [Deltaproteobacteria bacterium]|nr:4-hydroxy-3-methylbut-2-en-1-yl diphosphate synthase [Deltaproteobacteria bacterium]
MTAGSSSPEQTPARGTAVELPITPAADRDEDVRALARVVADPFRPRRRRTRVVRVGDVAIGGDEPIRIQSMTNTDTMDTAATVEQVTQLAEAGCEIVRVTAPSIRDAENLREIRRQLQSRGVEVPLVADIHFTPNAAMVAAEFVQKVRINPGNYADKKRFEIRVYDDAQYRGELERVAERFRPLVRRCRENGVAMRIGTNHGSLSDRIMNRFGDNAEGMVESALEFLDVCEDENYLDIIFSMKASNARVAIQAYRLLAARLERRAPGLPSYPFHLGVTEAGDGEDGRIKSAIGIGGLLEDGLGDTIRVSLTEDPVRELPVAEQIAARAGRVASDRAERGRSTSIEISCDSVASPFDPVRRATDAADSHGLVLGGESPVRVELEIELPAGGGLECSAELAARLSADLSSLRDVECESLLARTPAEGAVARVAELARELGSLGIALPISLAVGLDAEAVWGRTRCDGQQMGAIELARLVGTLTTDATEAEVKTFAEAARAHDVALEWELDGAEHQIPHLVRLATAHGLPASLSLAAGATLHDHRVLATALGEGPGARSPIVLRQRLGSDAEASLIDASVRLGGLLCDGIGDVVSMQARAEPAAAVDLAYRVLQGARRRTTRTEYISCPSCGRTLFDLEETTARIKARTEHLRGVKIAVMGCIVNGPGEMADADFGYVGSGVGRVTLYVGKQVVARAVPEAEAPDRLVELIREHGQWVDGTSDDTAGV